MVVGIEFVVRIFENVCQVFGWDDEFFDEFVLYQVSCLYMDKFVGVFGFDYFKILVIYFEFGNVGLVSVLIVLLKVQEMGWIQFGSWIVLMGIGLGFNCSMVEIVWQQCFVVLV